MRTTSGVEQEPIVVVSGLPRSGTSMMMRMLAAGGLEPWTDGVRTADADNPVGYFELERVRALERDASWIGEARGRVIKVIATLLRHLPDSERYRVVFMNRRMEEILASQREMLARRGQPADPADDAALADTFRRHLAKIQAWLDDRRNFELLHVDYNEIMRAPDDPIRRLNEFFAERLDVERMKAAVERTLYRQRT